MFKAYSLGILLWSIRPKVFSQSKRNIHSLWIWRIYQLLTLLVLCDFWNIASACLQFSYYYIQSNLTTIWNNFIGISCGITSFLPWNISHAQMFRERWAKIKRKNSKYNINKGKNNFASYVICISKHQRLQDFQ